MAFYRTRKNRKHNGTTFEYKQLVESVRVPGKKTPRQNILGPLIKIALGIPLRPRTQRVMTDAEIDDRIARAVDYATRSIEKEKAKREKKDAPPKESTKLSVQLDTVVADNIHQASEHSEGGGGDVPEK